ncbi:hypothetical protein RSW31_26455, partial [Escherichia coli]|uniref:hypothetical protein n=1 Tax=Escherichia coli TaxID=562 RepID=UPI0028DE13EC
VRTTVGAGTEHVQELSLAEGENRTEWTLNVEQPDLWWPHALGDQPLHDVTVEVAVAGSDVAGGGVASDRRVARTGLR